MKELIVTGDSWTFGSEIRNPELFSKYKDIPDWDERNDEYRISRIWPTLLSKKLGFDSCKNLSFVAASNDKAIRNLINYLTKEYISKNKDLSDIFVVIGLTSPERRDFYYKNKKSNSGWITLWPAWEHNYNQEGVNDFVKSYVSYFWNEEEFLNRYVNQLLYLQTLLESYNIQYLIFQSFYQPQIDYYKINTWKDTPYVNLWNNSFHGSSDTIDTKYYNGSSEREIWDMINPIKFMNKDKDIHSFHGYLVKNGQWSNKSNTDYNMLHPNEHGHKLWADELYNYIESNNLYRKI